MKVCAEEKLSSSGLCVSVILPAAVDRPYTYLCGAVEGLCKGDIVEVPLRSRRVFGVVCDFPREDSVPGVQLKSVIRRVEQGHLPEILVDFVCWVAKYNLASPGLFLRSFLSMFAVSSSQKFSEGLVYRGQEPERITEARRRVLDCMQDGVARNRGEVARLAGVGYPVIKGLVEQGVLEPCVVTRPCPFARPCTEYAVPELNVEQEQAVASLRCKVGSGGFFPVLLEGVTGSGKTEVYLELVAEVLRAGKQVLILLPEIALTGVFLDRFEKRFGVAAAQWNSNLSNGSRREVFRAVAEGKAWVVIGARSALFLPFVNLGLIIVDEEQDSSYKQDDVVSYNARDMAVKRAQMGDFPILLSSATPSVESWVNARKGQYTLVRLLRRFGSASLPDVQLIDLRKSRPEKGKFLSPVLRERMQESLDRGEQVLLFLNRRGYAPLIVCRLCGEHCTCPNCSTWMVEHRFSSQILCHYCGFSTEIPSVCPSCGEGDHLVSCGPGVERIAQEAEEAFPAVSRTLLSSDSTSGNLEKIREHFREIAEGKYSLIIGTQLIAKGHHFPRLSLVGVVDGDLGLGQGDLRASERSFQLLHQVIGRSGRESCRGLGMIQTYMPDHPVMQALVSGDRENFYKAESHLRSCGGFPPFGHLAALILSSMEAERALSFARRILQKAPVVQDLRLLGPAEAPLFRIRGRYRYRILVKAGQRFDLQSYLRDLLERAGAPEGDVRLQVDVDPQNFL